MPLGATYPSDTLDNSEAARQAAGAMLLRGREFKGRVILVIKLIPPGIFDRGYFSDAKMASRIFSTDPVPAIFTYFGAPFPP